MKESKLYINFFLKNLILIAIPAILFLILGYLYQANQPAYYQVQALYEFKYGSQDVQDKIVLADEVVTLLRSKQLQNQLGISSISQIKVFKPGPISLNITILSNNKNLINKDLSLMENYLISNYEVSKVGEQISSQINSNVYLIILGSLFIGGFLGLIIALIRTYFKSY